MKPILIFFYGDANIGKTSVLKKLGEWFRHRCIEYIELRDKSNSPNVK
jgi:thymidylate kinase